MSDADRLAVYADYVCPFCYLGKASLDRYLADRGEPLAVEWRPFDLRSYKRGPDDELRDDVDDGKDDAYFERSRRNVERLADEYGVEMRPTAGRRVDSWNAHLVGQYVEDHCDEATAGAYHDAVFETLWRDGRDVGDPAVLAEIGVSIGLDAEAVPAALADDEVEATLRDRFEAAQRTGVTAVPTFVYGTYAARGAVPAAQLEQLVDGTARNSPSDD